MFKNIKNFELSFSISKAAGIVGFFTLASRLMGLVRDRLFASTFGAGDALDSYYAAFRIPDFVFNLLILGTLSVAFIPIFSELLLKDKQKAYKTANSVLNATFFGMAALCFILFIFSSQLTKALVPGFHDAKFQETLLLTRIFLISPVIFTLSNVFTSILNAQKKFIAVGLAPILYNAGIIFGLLYLYPHYGMKGLGYGVVLGAVLHLLTQLPEAIRFGFRYQPIMDIKDPAIKKIGKLFLPRIFGMDNSQISLLIGSVIGSVLASGSIAVFNLANNLQAVPLGIFAISFSLAAFPLLSEQYAQKDEAAFSETVAFTAKRILFFIIPFSVLMVLERAQIVRLAFGSGKFDWTDTILTFRTLEIFCFSLFAQSLIPLFARSFYARHNTITPVIVNILSMIINATLAYFMGRSYGVTGVAGAFTIAAVFNFLALGVLLREQLVTEIADSIFFNGVGKILLSTVILGAVCYGSLYATERFLNTSTFIGLFLQAGISAGLAAIAYLLVASRLGLKTANGILRKFRLI